MSQTSMETEGHFPWVATLRNQLQHLSFGCTCYDYKKLLKKLESSLSGEVTKLKSKPKRSTKFSHILKNLISNLKLVQYAAKLESDESILSALGLIVTHYIHIIQSSSMLDREPAADIAHSLYSFIQIVLEQSREFILDTILALGSVDKTPDANPLIFQLFKNVLDDRINYQHDSRTFVKYLTMLKLLMEAKISEKKIRKILLGTPFPKDLSAYLEKKFKLRVDPEEIDFVFVLSKIKPELIIEKCKSILSASGLEKAEAHEAVEEDPLLNGTPLFFIDVGNNGIDLADSPDAEEAEVSTPHFPVKAAAANKSINLHENDDTKSKQTSNDTNEDKEGSENESNQLSLFESDEDGHESNNEAASYLEHGGEAGDAGAGGDNDSDSGPDDHNGTSGDGVDYDENHENVVVTDPESNEDDTPLLDCDFDLGDDYLGGNNNSAEELKCDESLVQQSNDNNMSDVDWNVSFGEEKSDGESTNSDDTVQLNVNKVRSSAAESKTGEHEESDSGSESNQNDLKLPNRLRELDDNSLSSTDTVDLSQSGRKRPDSDSPELKKAASAYEADTNDVHSAETLISESRIAPEISPRRTRAASRQRKTTPGLDNQHQAPNSSGRTRKQAVKVNAPRKLNSAPTSHSSRKKSAIKAAIFGSIAIAAEDQSKNQNQAQSAAGIALMKSFASKNTNTARAQKPVSQKSTTKEQINNTAGARRGRKPAVNINSQSSNSQEEDKDKSNEKQQNETTDVPTTPIGRITRSRATSSSPIPKSLPIIKRTRRASGSPSVETTVTKKTKVEVKLETAIPESGEESGEELVKLHQADGSTQTNAKTTQSTGERYNLRRRSTYKN